MLKAKGEWMPLGSADEQKLAEEGTVEAWGRSPRTQLADGMESRKVYGADLQTMYRP